MSSLEAGPQTTGPGGLDVVSAPPKQAVKVHGSAFHTAPKQRDPDSNLELEIPKPKPIPQGLWYGLLVKVEGVLTHFPCHLAFQ